MTAPSSPFIRSLRFLGRVQFTMLLLLGGAVILTIGTVLESRGSREIAWSVVYGTAWFDVFLFLIGVNLRKYGQEIIRTLGGRKVHPNFAVPGGVNKALTAADRDKILQGLDEQIATIQAGLQIMKDWAAQN